MKIIKNENQVTIELDNEYQADKFVKFIHRNKLKFEKYLDLNKIKCRGILSCLFPRTRLLPEDLMLYIKIEEDEEPEEYLQRILENEDLVVLAFLSKINYSSIGDVNRDYPIPENSAIDADTPIVEVYKSIAKFEACKFLQKLKSILNA